MTSTNLPLLLKLVIGFLLIPPLPIFALSLYSYFQVSELIKTGPVDTSPGRLIYIILQPVLIFVMVYSALLLFSAILLIKRRKEAWYLANLLMVGAILQILWATAVWTMQDSQGLLIGLAAIPFIVILLTLLKYRYIYFNHAQ